MGKRYALGIDVGGTKTMVGVFDEALTVRAEVKFRTHAGRGGDAFMKELDGALDAALAEANVDIGDIAGVGIGVAGLVSSDGSKIIDTPNIPFLTQCDLSGQVAIKGLPTPILANDCQVALFGEAHAGAARNARNVIGVFIGTGVGAALIIDGVPYFGSGGIAGNLGRFRVDPLAALAGSTRDGYVDDACSRTALASAAAALAVRRYAPYLASHAGTDLADIRSGDLRDAIAHGDGAVEELVRSRMRLLGIVLANLVDLLDPDLIVLGGGVVEAMPDLVRDEVKTALREHATPAAREHVKVAVAKLAGHAVTAGAAKLALLHVPESPTRRERRKRTTAAA